MRKYGFIWVVLRVWASRALVVVYIGVILISRLQSGQILSNFASYFNVICVCFYLRIIRAIFVTNSI